MLRSCRHHAPLRNWRQHLSEHTVHRNRQRPSTRPRIRMDGYNHPVVPGVVFRITRRTPHRLQPQAQALPHIQEHNRSIPLHNAPALRRAALLQFFTDRKPGRIHVGHHPRHSVCIPADHSTGNLQGSRRHDWRPQSRHHDVPARRRRQSRQTACRKHHHIHVDIAPGSRVLPGQALWAQLSARFPSHNAGDTNPMLCRRHLERPPQELPSGTIRYKDCNVSRAFGTFDMLNDLNTSVYL